MYNDLMISEIKGLKFHYVRRGCDVNGNPKYRIQVFSDSINVTSLFRGIVGRYNSKNDYITVISYNIESILCYIVESYDSKNRDNSGC